MCCTRGSNAAPAVQVVPEPATGFDRSIEELQQHYELALDKRSPREALELLSLMAALSVLHVLEVEGRYEQLPSEGLATLASTERERWFYSGDKIARVTVDEFPAYFDVLEYQSQVGMMVGVSDEELDHRLAGQRLPKQLVSQVEELVLRARWAERG